MRFLSVILAAALLVGCSGRDEPKELMNIRSSGSGPDEFAVTTNKPLEIPDNVATLGLPTPGGENRTEIKPEEMIADALGGSPSRGFADQAFVNSVSRFGVTDNIRAVLAQEDEAFRARAFVRPLERLARVNAYYSVYDRQSLDAYLELARLRQLGIETPTAPPQ